MFTGIIREVGTVENARKEKGLLRLDVLAPKTASLVEPMESVSVDGVCLSVVRKQAALLRFELIPETQRLSALSRLRSGSRVNLEPTLTLTDRLSGHIVLGHVDGIAKVAAVKQLPSERVLTLRADGRLFAYLVSKGSIAVDGVSLTIGQNVKKGSFSVHLIPETLRRTTLGSKKAGDFLNIEVDYLAKLVRQFLQGRRLEV